jgi:hypothetical protein
MADTLPYGSTPVLLDKDPVFATIAERPPADYYGGRPWKCQVGSVLFTSDGSRWTAAPTIVFNQYFGIVLPSLAAANAATYSQTGNLITVTSTAHNIPATVHNGKRVYIGGATVTTGAAIAAGLYDDFQMVDANTFTCVSAVSQTASGTLTTQTSTFTIPTVSYTLPGGSLSENGYFDTYHMSWCNASAGTKRMSFLYGTFSYKNPAPGATAVAIEETHRVRNNNSLTKQIAFATGSPGNAGPVTTVPVTGTQDSTVDKNITVQLTLNTASDYITLEHMTVTLFYG